MSVQVLRRYFSVGEFYRMAAAGIITDADRVELIDGEVIEMSPIGSRHAACVDRINALLHRHAGQSAIVRVQNPIRLNDFSEPQPDVALLKPREDFYESSHPAADDVLLVVEVADTSVELDRGVKVPLYARAGVAEVWLVDLTRDVIELSARPANGTYEFNAQFGRGQELRSETIESLKLEVESIVG